MSHSTAIDSTRSLPMFTPLPPSKSASYKWSTLNTSKLLDWIEINDPKYILPGIPLKLSADDLVKDVFPNNVDQITPDRVRIRVKRLKEKYETARKWLQLQKPSHETDKRKCF